MTARDTEPSGAARSAHVFAAHVRGQERLSYLLRAGPGDPPVYLTWRLRRAPGGCVVRLEIDEPEGADSPQDAEDVWLPVLAALQLRCDTSGQAG